jgi:hypothetical protein
MTKTINDYESIYCDFEVTMLKDMENAITQANLWEWLATYEPSAEKGFMYDRNPNLEKINKNMKYDKHSGLSYGWCMRKFQLIAKIGWEQYKADALKARGDQTLKTKMK